MLEPAKVAPTPRVLVIGLDAAELTWIERWIGAGILPNLGRLASQGSLARLHSPGDVLPDAPWPTFVTGVGAGVHGFYGYRTLRPGTLQLEENPNRLYRQPFWWLLRDTGRHAILFDVPKAPLVEAEHQTQIIGWGEKYGLLHVSQPPGLLAEIKRRFGEHPITADIPGVRGRREELAIIDRLFAGLERRVEVARFLMAEEDWHLGMVVFSETHTAGHQFYPHLDPASPWYDASQIAFREDTIEGVYRRVDASLGEIVKLAPPDADVVVLSVHGMEPRYDARGIVRPLLTRLGYQVPPAPGRSDSLRSLREWVPLPVRDRLNRLLPHGVQETLISRFLERSCDWSSTRAFAEDSSRENFAWIRVNLRGREPEGIVEPGIEYEALCEEIAGDLMQLRVHPGGEPAVRKVLRARTDFPGPYAGQLPDLIVDWQPGAAISSVFHPRAGIIPGDAPTMQSAKHSDRGFLLAAGPHFVAGADVAGRIEDVAPTLLQLLGGCAPQEMEGRALTAILDPEFVAAHPLQRVPSVDWTRVSA